MTPNADAMSAFERFHVPTASAISFGTDIVRPRLQKLLDQHTASPITLVLAPAGYGKSTLVAQWAAQCGHPVAWISLNSTANSLSTFLTTIAEALPATKADSAPDDRSSLESIVEQLHELAAAGRSVTLVFDDYHCVENRDVHDAMNGLLAQLPNRAGVVIVSRTQPPLALGRPRANGRVNDMTPQELSFTADEVAAVAEETSPGNLTADQVQDLHSRTEGWIAGIRLALASLDQVDPAISQSLLDTRIAQNWLDDYMVEEVLNRLSSDARDFVIRTTILTRLEPVLCNAVLEIEQSAALIDTIRRHLVFVRPDGQTVVYHGLFADSVNRIAERDLGQAELHRLHRRAAEWFENHGQLDAATNHAIAAEDWDLALRCIRPLCRDLMDRDAHHSRLYWLERLPESLILADPHLARWYVSALLYTGQHRRALMAGRIVAPAWEKSGDPVQLGYLAAFHAFVELVNGQPDAMLIHVNDSLQHYPLDCHVERMHAWSAVAGYEFTLGNDDISERAFVQASICRQYLPAEQWWWALLVEPDRANQRTIRGDLETAEAMYQLILEQMPSVYRSHEAKIRYRLAAIYLEWNDLKRARVEAERVEREMDTFPPQIWHPEALLVVARVYSALGEQEARDDVMRRARALCTVSGGRKCADLLDALQASIWLEEGSLNMVQNWARTRQHMDHTHLFIFGDPDPHLVLVQLDLITGDVSAAESRLQPLVDRALSAKRWAEIVPLLVWQVATRVELGDEAGALVSLREVLRHAQSGGFVRSLLTPRYDLTPFIDRIRPQLTVSEADYLDRTRIVEPASMPTPEPPEPISVPPQLAQHDGLTGREREVATLLVHGLTNKDIAARLYISRRTAQKHVINILAKLHAPNRTAAVRRLRDLTDFAP